MSASSGVSSWTSLVEHFFTGAELEREELLALINEAEALRVARERRRFLKPLQDRTLALIFEKPSLRTRVSFTVAMQELGGNVIELNSSSLKKEEPEDTIRVLQGYCDAVMLRTYRHDVFARMAAVSRIPVVNGLSDLHHPCQAVADLLTLKQAFGKLDGLSVAYVGDGNNVLHSLLLLAPFLGIELRYACPEGFDPAPQIVAEARVRALAGGGAVRAFRDPREAVRAANAIYTDVWTSMGFEAETLKRDAAFEGFQINDALYAFAAKDAIILHCLPMVREKEITSALADHENSRIFQQSENRLHAQKALLARLFKVDAVAQAQSGTRMNIETVEMENQSWRRSSLRPV
jgi:ornithine carbamoyltransferase